MSDNKVIQMGDIVKYKNEYPDEIGSTYKITYIDDNFVEMEYISNMTITPLFSATLDELEVIK
jgi:hypothetical protein